MNKNSLAILLSLYYAVGFAIGVYVSGGSAKSILMTGMGSFTGAIAMYYIGVDLIKDLGKE